MNNCEFCNIQLNNSQKVILENKSCYFLQLEEFQKLGVTLEGAGVIIPKIHRATVFDLTQEEWNDNYHLLQQVKATINEKHKPAGYNIGWNVHETGGQHINHAHMHVMSRYEDERLAGKGIRSHLKHEDNKRGFKK